MEIKSNKTLKIAIVLGTVLFSLSAFTVFAFVTFFFLNFIGIEVDYSLRNFVALFAFIQFRALYKGFIKGIQNSVNKLSDK